MEDFKIDGHKLMYHVGRVNQWVNREDIYPIYLEISPTGACNHRCAFCAFDYLDYKSQLIEKNVIQSFISEASMYGVKAVMFSGIGEPLMYKEIVEVVLQAKRAGVDVAITTNGVFINEDIIKRCLGVLTWLRVSLDAGKKETYAKIHKCDPSDFNRVLANLEQAVKQKKKNNYTCTIGAQLVLLPENLQEVALLVAILKDINVDYLIVKPFSQHPMSRSRIYEDFDYLEHFYLAEQLKEYSSKNFNIVFRTHSMKKLKEKKPYLRCLGVSFFAFITSDGNIYPCQTFVGNEQFCFGNINKASFLEIFNSPKRKKILQFISNRLDVTKCRQACRLDEINSYLWELRHPPAHVNFI